MYLRPSGFSLSFLFKIAFKLFPHFDLTLLMRIAVPELSVLEIGGIFNLQFVQDILTFKKYSTDIGHLDSTAALTRLREEQNLLQKLYTF